MNSLNIPECPPAEPLPPMSKRSLLQKYEIPVNHLDFDYVRECKDAKEVERMLLILRSGEEGHFPDLQLCTEQRLIALNPRSKVLRQEEPVIRASHLPRDEREKVNADMTVSVLIVLYFRFLLYVSLHLLHSGILQRYRQIC